MGTMIKRDEERQRTESTEKEMKERDENWCDRGSATEMQNHSSRFHSNPSAPQRATNLSLEVPLRTRRASVKLPRGTGHYA